MRDTKCDKEFVQRIIKTYGREINDSERDIAKLNEAIKNNIQLYRGENEEVLFLKKCNMFRIKAAVIFC
ncbi:MAG: hypothetical protein NC086_08315 [Alistipes sp.]|nr:hypothetical protein [Alistipes sp.]